MRTPARPFVVLAILCACAGDSGGAEEAATGNDTFDPTGSEATSVDPSASSSSPTTSVSTEPASSSDASTTDDGESSSGSDESTTGWVPPSDCGGGALADLAAGLGAGELVEMEPDGLTADLVDAGGGHNILQYSDKGVWDPNTCQALFTGGGHLTLVKFIAYSASENVWFHAPNPTWWCETTQEDPYACATHAYGHNALDPATGRYWFRTFNSAPVYRTQVASPIVAEWEDEPALPSGPASCIATALEYFPELGGLVYVDCTGQTVQLLPDGGAAWETLPGNYAMGAYHNYGVYNPVLGQLLFGAGNGSLALHLLDAAGTGTQIAEPPRGFHPSPDDPSTFRILTVDPISGRFLAYAPAGDLFEYDAGADMWTEVAVDVPTDLAIAIPITTYGVVMLLAAEPRMYIYRHTDP